MTQKFTIQEILGAYLSTHGRHEEAAQAYTSTERTEWLRLGEIAMRTAPPDSKIETCQAIKLVLDAPENGGAGTACDFEIVREPHKMQEGRFMYRGYRIDPNGGKVDTGLVSEVFNELLKRLVGAYVVCAIKLNIPHDTKV
jgi:hypothetical protein